MKRFDPGGVLSIREVLDLEGDRDVRVAGRVTSVKHFGEHAPHMVHFVIEDKDDEMGVILPPSAWIWSVYVVYDREIAANVRVVENEDFVQAIAESVWPKDTLGISPFMLKGIDKDKLCRCFLPILVS